MYCSLTAEHSADWFESQEIRRTAAAKRFFYVRQIMATLYGRVVWEAERLAGSLSRSLNPHGSAHPHESGEAENLNRLIRSFTMAKSKGATAPASITISKHAKYTLYTGTKEQLIDSGIALERHFPAFPKRVKYETFESPYGNQMICVSSKKGGVFEVHQTEGFLLYRIDAQFRHFMSGLVGDAELSLVKGEMA